jgi:hypothetical protein
MKMTKKKVFVAAIAVSLVAILSLGTIAWFQYTDTVDNIFKVTADDSDQNPDFKLDLFEHDVLDDGSLGTSEVDTNTYDHIAPGDNLSKDPTVRNDGQYDQWVRIKVTLSNYADWQTVMGNGYDFSTILTGVSTDWTLDTTTVGTGTLIYYKATPLTAGSTSTLFTGVNVPSEFTVDNMPLEFHLNVVAEAIQSANTGNNAKSAFENYWS